jgi:hypothetical protein
MPGSFTCRGVVGELRWGYHLAAVLGPWTLAMSPGGLDLTATVVSHDAFRTSQPSVTFHVTRQDKAPWVWPVESLQIANGVLSARLTQTE